MQGKGNIENFLRTRLENLESNFQSDWSVFEQKLEHALYLKRLQRLAWMGFTSIFFIGLFVGFNLYEYYNSDDYYLPRHSRSSAIYPAFHSSFTTGRTIKTVPAPAGKKSLVSGNFVPATPATAAFPAADRRGDKTPSTAKPAISSPGGLRSVSTGSGSSNDPAPVTTVAAGDPVTLLSPEELDIAKSNIASKSIPIHKGQRHSTPTPEQYASFHYERPVLSLRTPVEAVKIRKMEPYISPLQKANPWSYSINVYPNFTFRKFSVDEDKLNMLHRDFIDAVKSSESGGFSLNIGFEVSRRIGAITFLNSGIEYISYKNEVIYNFTNFRDAHINPTTGEIESYTMKTTSEQVRFSDHNTYNYLNIPLSVSYQPWATDHIRLNIELGGSYLHFISAHGQTLNYKTLEVVDLSSREFKKSIGSFCFKIGGNYYVSEKINIGFEPTLMYFTNTIYSNSYPFYVIPYSVGMNINLQVKLN